MYLQRFSISSSTLSYVGAHTWIKLMLIDCAYVWSIMILSDKGTKFITDFSTCLVLHYIVLCSLE